MSRCRVVSSLLVSGTLVLASTRALALDPVGDDERQSRAGDLELSGSYDFEERSPGLEQNPEPPETHDRQTVRTRRLRTAGWIIFGVSYGLSLVLGVAICADGDGTGALLILPVAGTAAVGIDVMQNTPDQLFSDIIRGIGGALVVDAALQLLGLSLLVSTAWLNAEDDTGSPSTTAQHPVAIRLSPLGPSGTPGLSATAGF